MNVWSRRLLAAAMAALALGLAGCVGDATDSDDEGELLVARSPLTITPPPASKPEASSPSTGTLDPKLGVILEDTGDDGSPVDPDPNPWAPQLPSSPGSEQTKK